MHKKTLLAYNTHKTFQWTYLSEAKQPAFTFLIHGLQKIMRYCLRLFNP